jgi:flagellar basal-body rod modification protein FlgD
MNITSATDTTSTQSTSAGATSAASTAGPSGVDYNTFLQLLIAEMKNQDPTAPTDPTQYMSQFAQFSSVEQAVQTNSKLDALLASSALSQADGLIGRTASYTDSTGATVSGQISSISINTNGAIATLQDGTRIPVGAGLTIS